MNVVVLGKPIYEIILESESFPVENAKMKASNKLEIAGGASVYVACMLSKWGIPVHYIGTVCGDEIGNKIKQQLESYNVETKYIEVDYEHKSCVNYCLINKATGSSTQVLHDNEVYLKRYKFDILPDYIIIDGSDIGAANAAINNYPKAKVILLANQISNEIRDLSKKCHYVCATMNFAQALTKMNFEFNRNKSQVELFQKIKDLNKADYIIMLRDRGVLYTKERQVKMIPAVPIEKKDDANSGSSFFGAYCYGILKGLDIDTVAKSANVAGALALTKIGSLNTIPDKEEVYRIVGVSDTPANQVSNETLDMPIQNNETTEPQLAINQNEMPAAINETPNLVQANPELPVSSENQPVNVNSNVTQQQVNSTPNPTISPNLQTNESIEGLSNE